MSKAGSVLSLIGDPATPEFPHGKPRLIFFNNCINVVEQLPAMVIDPHNKEDVVEGGDDHAYDALRYELQKAFGTAGKVRIRGF